MKRAAAPLAAAMTVGVLGLGVARAEASTPLPGPSKANVAHRGWTGWGAPENTHASMRHAVNAGFGGVEFDVRLTKDKKWVLLHDTTLDRTTSCTGSVSSKKLDSVVKCDASSPKSKAKVPTYESTMAYIGKLSGSTQVFVHVKVRTDSTTAKSLVKAAKALKGGTKRVVFLLEKDSDRQTLIKAGWDGPRARPEVMPFGLMIHRTEDWKLAGSGAYSVAVPYDAPSRGLDAILSSERLARLAETGVTVYGLPGTPQSVSELQEVGVTRFFL